MRRGLRMQPCCEPSPDSGAGGDGRICAERRDGAGDTEAVRVDNAHSAARANQRQCGDAGGAGGTRRRWRIGEPGRRVAGRAHRWAAVRQPVAQRGDQRTLDRSLSLQQVYHKRYIVDTAKKLAAKTSISEDTKSGVITITVEDTDRGRARDIAQAYVDELNLLVARVNTSSARREREFIEQRLQTVDRELQQAQEEMSDFSTRHAAIDIKEQTRAMVDAGARLQGQLTASESELESLQQIYGDQNSRVRAAEARVGTLRHELERESDGGGAATAQQTADDTLPYPALRQLPALAVPWENLYRRVRIEETVYEMLSAQYETARIEEAKSIPTVSVIDAAGWPEKKSSPHRVLIVLVATGLALVLTSLFLLARRSWLSVDEADTRRVLAREMAATVQKYRPLARGGSR